MASPYAQVPVDERYPPKFPVSNPAGRSLSYPPQPQRQSSSPTPYNNIDYSHSPYSSQASGRDPYGSTTNLRPGHHPQRSTTQFSYLAKPSSAPGLRIFWNRLRGDGRAKVSWGRSFLNLAGSSWLNVLFVFIPLSWVSHFLKWDDRLTLSFSFLALMPLEHLFEYGGKQMSLYLGTTLGDLVIISLKNAVEAALALVLLAKCELKLLQSSVAGFILLQLLLVPGTTFLSQGSKVLEQDLQPHVAQLNQTLLMIGMVTLLLPATFFASIGGGTEIPPAMTPEVQYNFLRISRGLSVLLLVVYIGSRVYLHNPPGVEVDALHPHAHPEALRHEERARVQEAELNPWFGIFFLSCTVVIMGFTAEWLVFSLKESVKDELIYGRLEWFGLILLPLVSFSGDGIISVSQFVRHALGKKTRPPQTLAEARPIDMSVQFVLFWLPFFVLISWWSGRALYLLLDMFEVAALFGAIFLVNYVTADSKTNWAEGLAMVVLYIMIALVAWFYPGQEGQKLLLSSCLAQRNRAESA